MNRGCTLAGSFARKQIANPMIRKKLGTTLTSGQKGFDEQQ